MNAERWHRIEALFDQALELPEAERGAFVDDVCAADLETGRELKSLIDCAPAAGAALRSAVVAEVRAFARGAVASQVGRRIGPFRVIGLLGEGGMGAVYLAERDDAQFAQRVAVKILPHAIGAPEAVARFRDERQILAALEHPNIVRLLDGGSTDDDLPYLVMEHIEGMAITRYAEQHRLAMRARVDLVRRVCSALQYAHQNLVVHRDIKPSNILVDASGAPKILDFGIAKLLAPVAAFAREARTRTGLAMFTPEYASPEQARGDAVATATDVYSAGAVLYELVSGQPAHRAVGGGQLEVLRVICEVDPPRPSAVAPAAQRRELVGDLDNIILKALHKEPARRYASMEQLSDDLQRWLDGMPVTARTATLRYRTGKFVRRNKRVVIATALAASALIAATFVSLRQARRADDQAVRAQTERSNADAERSRAIESAQRAQLEADRARDAEARLQKQFDALTTEQDRRARAEADARAKGAEVDLSREQLQAALARVQDEKRVAEQEKQVAEQQKRVAEQQQRVAEQQRGLAEQAQRQLQVRLDQERERVKQLETARQKITSELR